MITSTYIFNSERHVARAARRWAGMSYEERREAAKKSFINPPEGFRAEEFLGTVAGFDCEVRFNVIGYVEVRHAVGEYEAYLSEGLNDYIIRSLSDQELVEWISSALND